jgi:hypothetical protein
MIDKFETAANTRQAILDYANKHGRCTCIEVAAYIGISNDHANRSMNKMVADGEMERIGAYKHVVYIPLATKARSADEMRERMIGRRRTARAHEVEKAKAKAKRTGRFVHVCSDTEPPIKNQGGQGAIRRGVTIQAIEL